MSSGGTNAVEDVFTNLRPVLMERMESSVTF